MMNRVLSFSEWVTINENQNNIDRIKMDIPRDILAIYKEFKNNGYSLYVVGGAVRDAILGKKPKDFDLATNALPDEVIRIARDKKWKVIEVGKSFGVVIINGHEIATFREDVGTGRRPDSVKFTTIEGDVKRRDLTINALFYDIDKEEIVDLVGGKPDITTKTIRTVGDPRTRFQEDPLRKLRALRFHALLGGNMDNDTLNALKDDPDISSVSAERIRDEFIKSIYKAKSSKKYLTIAYELGFLQQIFPTLKISTDFIDEKNHILLTAWILRENTVDVILDILTKRTWSNKEKTDIAFLLDIINFNAADIYKYKIKQKKISLTDKDLIRWGGYIGVDLNKFVEFELSVTAKDAPSDVKGKDLGNWIINKEFELFNQN